MASITVYSGTADGWLQSSDNNGDGNYEGARDGSVNLVADTTGVILRVGQRFAAAAGGRYFVYEAFLNFDLFAAGLLSTDTVSAVTLSMWPTTDLSTTDFTVEAWSNNWGATLTTADWINCALVETAPVIATRATSDISTGSYNDFTEVGTSLKDAISTALAGDGVLRIALVSDNTRLDAGPFGNEYVEFSSADETGTTQDPKLVITYSGAAAPKTRYFYEHVAGMGGR